MKPARSRLRLATEVALFRAARGAAALLPPRTVRALGAGVGRLGYALDGRHRAIGRDNLAAAFPEWSAERVDATLRACFAHFSTILFEMLQLRGWTAERIGERVRIEGAEHHAAARALGRGVLVISAHMGNWELGALVAGCVFGGVDVVGRRLDNPRLEAELAAARSRFGNGVIDKRDGARAILRSLAAGHSVAILIDQSVQAHEGAAVPFFGRPALTSTAVARIAMRRDVPVVPVWCLPAAEPGTYVLRFSPAIPPPAAPDPEGIAFTAALTAEVERAVRERPELWLWLHRRWRER